MESRRKTAGKNRIKGQAADQGPGPRYHILDWILKKYEGRTTKSDWRQEKTGNKSLKIQQEHFDAAGKTELLSEIRELEEQGLIRIKYFSG